MKTLDELQTAFCNAIIERSPPDFICSDHSEARLNVYRQTILDNMRNALSAIFPGIWILLGEECANSVAYAFCLNKIHFPSKGCLDDWGDQFPNFLSEVNELKDLPYLRDYAYYEWLKHQSYRAESLPIINVSDLQVVPEELIESIQFSFHPSVFSYNSDYPINEIDKIVNNIDETAIELKYCNAYGIITRFENSVQTVLVASDLWLFIHSLQEGKSLKEATSITEKKHPDFNLQEALEFLLKYGLISKIHY